MQLAKVNAKCVSMHTTKGTYRVSHKGGTVGFPSPMLEFPQEFYVKLLCIATKGVKTRK